MKRTLLATLALAAALVVRRGRIRRDDARRHGRRSRGRSPTRRRSSTPIHGKVTITMLNLQLLKHDIAIKETKKSKKPIAKGQEVGKGKTSKVTANPREGLVHLLLHRPRPRSRRHVGCR